MMIHSALKVLQFTYFMFLLLLQASGMPALALDQTRAPLVEIISNSSDDAFSNIPSQLDSGQHSLSLSAIAVSKKGFIEIHACMPQQNRIFKLFVGYTSF